MLQDDHAETPPILRHPQVLGLSEGAGVAIDTSAVPQCVACGCCCFSNNPRYLTVAGVDYERLGSDAELLTEFVENQAFMRMVDGHCAALTFSPSASAYLCGVYEKRPDVCRWLERGSGQCRAERHEKVDRPLTLSRKPVSPQDDSPDSADARLIYSG